MTPMVAMQFIEVGNTIIDSLMISNYNPTAMGVISITSTTIFTVLVFFFGLFAMSSPLMGQANGAGNRILIGRILRTTAFMALIVFIVLFCICLYTNEILRLFNLEKYFVDIATQYVDGRKYSLILIVSLVYRFFLSSQKILTPILILNLLILPLNALLNWMFIFGNLGIKEMGVYGAGLATSLSTILFAICILIISSLKAHKNKIQIWKNFFSLDKKIARSIISMGFFIGIATLIELSLFTVGGYFVIPLGTDTITAYAILYQIWSLWWALSFGMGDGLGVFVANEAGKRARTNIIKSVKVTLIISIFISFISSIILYSFSEEIIKLYFDSYDEKTVIIVKYTMSAIWILLIGTILEAKSQIPSHILRNLNDTIYLPIFQVIGYVIIGLGSSYFLGLVLKLGLIGIIGGMCIGIGFTVFMLWCRLLYILNPNRIFLKV